MKRRGLIAALALLACLCGYARSDADLLPTQAYTTITKTATATSPKSATTLWTPASGYRFVLQGCLVSASSANSVRLQVSGTDVVPPIYLPSYGSLLVGSNYAPIYMSDVDAVLTYTTSGFGAISILCWGYEITP